MRQNGHLCAMNSSPVTDEFFTCDRFIAHRWPFLSILDPLRISFRTRSGIAPFYVILHPETAYRRCVMNPIKYNV